jgi:hypothetical protein
MTGNELQTHRQSLELLLHTERDELYLIVGSRLSTASITVPLL